MLPSRVPTDRGAGVPQASGTSSPDLPSCPVATRAQNILQLTVTHMINTLLDLQWSECYKATIDRIAIISIKPILKEGTLTIKMYLYMQCESIII